MQNPLDDTRRTTFLDRFDHKYRGDVANNFFRAIRNNPETDLNELCRTVWLSLKERSHMASGHPNGLGSGSIPFATFAKIAREVPQEALNFCQWAKEWECLTKEQKEAYREPRKQAFRSNWHSKVEANYER